MWEATARAAADDAGSPGALADLGSLQVVYCQSWEYDDPCGRLADRLGAHPAVSAYSGLGGSVPVRLATEAARAMADGHLDSALIVGGEALATKRHLPDPAWSHRPETPRPYPISIDRDEAANGIFQAYLTFALLDTARRAHLGESPAVHQGHLGRLMAPLSAVAAAHPEHAWFPVARAPDEIAIPSPSNRMVSSPYTKLMTAIMDVDMAAAILLATDERADALGVPPDQRVYLRGAGSDTEPAAMASRPEPWRSPAMARAMQAALGSHGIDDVGHLDLYSCFASSLAFACDALGIAPDRSLTVTGGLPYHGGPGSNYATHSLAAMAQVLRAEPGAFGLVSGVGMHMTSHAASLWSSEPGPLPPPSTPDTLPSLPVTNQPDGPGRVVTFSTVYSRQGAEATSLICDLPDGSRSYARLDQPAGDGDDLVGATVTLVPEGKGRVAAHR